MPPRLDLTCAYALTLCGSPYQWGGAGPNFDCSGFVIELLKSAGIGPPHDMTAQQLFEYYKPKSEWDKKERGALAFYGRSTGHITHVGFLLSESIIVEAGGGDSTVRTIDMAQIKSAFVRLRDLDHRKDLVAVISPHYPL